MKTHVMLDLETLGTQPGCVILSIAAIAFDPYGSINIDEEENFAVLDEPHFYGVVNMGDCLEAGLTVDPNTLNWWMKQNEDARLEAFGHGDHRPESLSALLGGFDEFVRRIASGVYNKTVSGFTEDVYVWSHGAGFDIPILSAAYHALGLREPWKFRNARDTRTLFDLCPPDVRPVTSAPQHHALWDAAYQVRQVQHSLRQLQQHNFVVGSKRLEQQREARQTG